MMGEELIMRDKPTIEFDLPVPWGAKSARIHASGLVAVIVAGVVAAMIVIAIICYR